MGLAKGKDRAASAVVLGERLGVDPRLVPAPGFTVEQRSAFAYAVGRGKSRTAAAREVGVPWSVVGKALDSDAGFRSAVEAAEVEKWQLAEDKLWSALEAGERWAVELVVKQAGGLRDRWKPAVERVEVVQEIGPGAERVLELAAELERRRLELGAGSAPVIDLPATSVRS